VGALVDGHFWQWAIWLVYHQKHYEIPLPQVKITFFELFYTYIALHGIKKIKQFYTYT
jgi:hypothetical protein